MMRSFAATITLVLAAFLVSGCIGPKSYVDTTLPQVDYGSIQRRAEPLRSTVIVEFQRNGENFPQVEPVLRDTVTRVLRATGVFAPSDNSPDSVVRVVVNNIADRGAAAAQGFGAGLTFGAIGTTVTDNYEMSLSVSMNGTTHRRTGLRHSLHTAIGNTSLPPGVQPVTPSVAFQRVVEAMLLTGIEDLQRNGELNPSSPLISQLNPMYQPGS